MKRKEWRISTGGLDSALDVRKVAFLTPSERVPNEVGCSPHIRPMEYNSLYTAKLLFLFRSRFLPLTEPLKKQAREQVFSGDSLVAHVRGSTK